MNQQSDQILNEITRLTALIHGSLKRGGLVIGFEEVAMPLMFAHLMDFGDDLVCVAYKPRNGYLLKTGVHLPSGENPMKPSSVELYASLERDGAGIRLNKRTNHALWYARFWSPPDAPRDLGDIRRDVLGETNFRPPTRATNGGQVDEALQRMAALYMGLR